MNSNEFRKELQKIMPGYKWTVHRKSSLLPNPNFAEATGIQTAGFSRISTLYVSRTEKDETTVYKVKSSGYGKKSPWIGTNTDGTLARALRGLQDHYERMASMYRGATCGLQVGRGK